MAWQWLGTIILDMILDRIECESCTKADILDATWWRYKAATQDCMVAKCKVLTMFYHGVLISDIHM